MIYFLLFLWAILWMISIAAEYFPGGDGSPPDDLSDDLPQ